MMPRVLQWIPHKLAITTMLAAAGRGVEIVAGVLIQSIHRADGGQDNL